MQRRPFNTTLTFPDRLAKQADLHAYRVYLVGPDGHIINRVDLLVHDDASAKECARGLLNNTPVELWDGDRKIAEFKPEPARDLVQQAAEEYVGDLREIVDKLRKKLN